MNKCLLVRFTAPQYDLFTDNKEKNELNFDDETRPIFGFRLAGLLNCLLAAPGSAANQRGS
jgi:hypothetical protein